MENAPSVAPVERLVLPHLCIQNYFQNSLICCIDNKPSADTITDVTSKQHNEQRTRK